MDVASKIAEIRNRASQLGLQAQDALAAGQDTLSLKVIGRFGGSDGGSRGGIPNDSGKWQEGKSGSLSQPKVVIAGESVQKLTAGDNTRPSLLQTAQELAPKNAQVYSVVCNNCSGTTCFFKFIW